MIERTLTRREVHLRTRQRRRFFLAFASVAVVGAITFISSPAEAQPAAPTCPDVTATSLGSSGPSMLVEGLPCP